MAELQSRIIHSLQKVFLDREPVAQKFEEIQLVSNAPFNFQIAFSGAGSKTNTYRLRLTVDFPFPNAVSTYIVESVPCERPIYHSVDRFYERTVPGLYPDVLRITDGNAHTFVSDLWYAAYLTIDPRRSVIPAGVYKLKISLICDEEGLEKEHTVTLRVLAGKLPEQKLRYTNWFHCDCICDAYGCEMFSEPHWKLIEKFMRLATEHGQNQILVPAFTPPLDTPVGKERKTAQLVDVKFENGVYRFSFDKFIRFIRLAKKCGFTYFEHSHLFSQWGAKAAPKIVATVRGKQKVIFGWDTDASGEEYKSFIHAYIRALMPILKELHISKKFYFHVSDEPHKEDFEAYSKARTILVEALAPYQISKYQIVDALSDLEFLERKQIYEPIVCTPEAGSFLGKTDHLGLYYTGLLPDGGYIGFPATDAMVIAKCLSKFERASPESRYRFPNQCNP